MLLTSEPYCIQWIDEFDDEQGFRVTLQYDTSSARPGETFVYEVGPDITRVLIPEEQTLISPEQSQADCFRRAAFSITVVALRPSGEEQVGGMAGFYECGLMPVPEGGPITVTAVVEASLPGEGVVRIQRVTLATGDVEIMALEIGPDTQIQTGAGQPLSISDLLRCTTITATGRYFGPTLQAGRITHVEVAEAPLGRFTGTVTADALNLRANPIPGVDVLDVLPRGTRLNVRGRCHAWLAVTTADVPRGWVHGDYVALEGATLEALPVLRQAPGGDMGMALEPIRFTALVAEVDPAKRRIALEVREDDGVTPATHWVEVSITSTIRDAENHAVTLDDLRPGMRVQVVEEIQDHGGDVRLTSITILGDAR
ncbi:MAG TPA: SH3 domain-containing protein [Ardenticatenaceae bacterium]|nr:SH3 domain-containing protein [Ardenticatenaceae bacterium]